MPENRVTHCSICQQPIKTVRGALRLTNAPLVCRRCFGEQSYAGSARWAFGPVTAESVPSES